MLKKKSMEALAKILKAKPAGVAKLNLRDNQLKDEGMDILAKALATNSSIMHLDVS